MSLRRFALVSLISFLFGCVQDLDARRCASDGDCLQGGVPGQCLASPSSAERWCAFSDGTCTSGKRWGILTGESLANQCLAGNSSQPDSGTSGIPDAAIDAGSQSTSPDARTFDAPPLPDAFVGVTTLEANRTTFDFGSVQTGDSATIDFTITNSGTKVSSSLAVVATGTGFTRIVSGSSDCLGLALGAGASCTVRAKFTPSASGAASGKITVSADDASVDVMLAGSGLPPGSLTLSTIASFGSLTIGQTSSSKTVTVTNAGGSPSGPVTASLAETSSFQILSSTCSGSLDASATCTVTVQFKQLSVGSKAVSLLISSTLAGSTSGQLSGTGTATLMVSRLGCDAAGCGKVTGTGIDCGSDCSQTVSTPTVTLMAAPDNCVGVTPAIACWSFTGWQGACSGTGNCTVPMDVATKSVTATFARTRYTLTFVVRPHFYGWGPGTPIGVYTTDAQPLCAPSSLDGSTTETCVYSFPIGYDVNVHTCSSIESPPLIGAIEELHRVFPPDTGATACMHLAGPNGTCPAGQTESEGSGNVRSCHFTLDADSSIDDDVTLSFSSP